MTPRQIELVRLTFAMIAPSAEAAAAMFYRRLFELDPSLRAMFRGDIGEQGRKLMHVIGVAVGGLDRVDALLPTLHDLGRRHAGFGVESTHYDTVASALLWTLERGVGADFTAEARDAWAAAYGALASAMQQGAASAAQRALIAA